MKITEQTTLAELQTYLKACGDPFVTLMMGHPHGAHPRHAIVHVPEVGTFHGGGATVAEALEAALTEFRRATLPEELKQFLDGNEEEILFLGRVKRFLDGDEESEHDQYDRATGDLGRPIAPSRIGVSLAEQTQRIMETLTPREREVLDMRMRAKRERHRWVASSVDHTPACVQCGNHPAHEIHRCHGCGETETRHPNDSGCEQWHEAPDDSTPRPGTRKQP